MQKIIIVEDEPELASNIAELTSLLGYSVSGIFNNSTSCLEFLSNHKVDLILLDILIKGNDNGIVLAESIKKQYDTPIIFCSAYTDDNMLQQVKQVNPQGYIVKPFNRDILKTTMFLALNNHSQKKEEQNTFHKETFHIRDKGYVVPLEINNILIAKADGLYTKIITPDKNYLIRDILKDIEARLPQDKFLRVHKSFLVNLDHVTSFNSKGITINKQVIPVRRGLFKTLKEMFGTQKEKGALLPE
ncbi:DNA-binding response regulator [Pedobacter sp. HMWF019]|uniref:LytR/AlgR family response regulator transcription factor n=1 Tax=Pedobacter sp. HMWF019 TaxID=2056856 RepID=UPI000D39B1E3|nr:response regulator [Pedobacter sp. HMWF019]PTS92096.1 DNA-binding response regulator [Pedobacter sp. HMWF019]